MIGNVNDSQGLTAIDLNHAWLLLDCSISVEEPGAKMTQVEACVATYIIMVYCNLSQLQMMTDKLGRLHSHMVCMVAEVASGKGHAQTRFQSSS